MRVFATVAFLLALGPLAGCAAPGGGEPTGIDPVADAAFTPVSYEFDGEFLAGGVDAPVDFPFKVPVAAGEVEALLTWTIPGAILDFQLLGPDGTVVADGWAESAMRRYVTTTRPPTAGNWSAVVTAERGVDVHFSLEVAVRAAEPFGPIDETYGIAGGTFAEVNLNMVPGERFNYSWAADGELYFNIHYHANGATERAVEFTGRSHAGEFVAPDVQVYSLLLRNEGILPVSVDLAVDGTYRLHSMTRQ